MEIVKAASAGDVKTVVSWIDCGGKVDTRYSKPDGSAAGGTLLITASDAGDAQMVDALLERRATLDLQDSFGNSALMHAAGGEIGAADALSRAPDVHSFQLVAAHKRQDKGYRDLRERESQRPYTLAILH